MDYRVDANHSNKRIAKNTIFLYLRMIVTMTVGLYTSRVILKTLGISDFGLYNVVGGFVAMLGFLNVTMANGTQRFLSFTLGENNVEKLRAVFSNSLIIHILITFIALLLAETVGLWFVINKLNIPEGREIAALLVYQFSIITFAISVLQVPFLSSIVAHERMNIYAYLSIYDAIMKLLIVYFVCKINYDKLVLYSIMICIVQLSCFFIYVAYCKKSFKEVTFRMVPNRKILKEMTGFSIWTLVGSLGYTTNGEGINVLLNMFWGTAVNAARGVAFQVNNVILGFSRNFQVAANPQIVKLYAEGDVKGMTDLALRTSRLSGYLLLILMLPFFLGIEFILKIWLGKYPEETPLFLRIILLQSLIQSLAGPVVTVTHAGGKLKMPNLTGGLFILSSLPVCYLALRLGCSPGLVLLINIYPWLLETFFDAYYAQKYTGFSLKRFYNEVYLKVFFVSALSVGVSILVTNYLHCEGFIKFLMSTFICEFIVVALVVILGLYPSERTSLLTGIKNKIRR